MVAEGSQRPVDDLKGRAQTRFGALRQAELKLLRATPKGEVAWCGPSDKNDDPANDPAKADEWGHERDIRADLIRWLCVDRDAKTAVDPRGIQIYAARITGPLDLSFVSVPFPLRLRRCCFTHNVNLTSTDLPTLILAGSRVQSVIADGINAKVVFLGDRFSAEGTVLLRGAQIGGTLNCSGGTFKNPGKDALTADGADVQGDVFLRDGFSAEGEVRLLGARIGGDLACGGGAFKNPGKDALSAERADVKGSVFLRGGFRAEGGVRLLGARIGGNLDCSGGTFKNPGKTALHADRAEVGGNVFLSSGFSAEGTLHLLGAQIGGDLNCHGGTLSGLVAETSTTKGNFLWLRIKNPEATTLDLANAFVGSIIDDEKSWPKPGNLFLDGFAYGRFSGDETPNDASTRLKWLKLQDKFFPQPYRQLAKALREMGDEDGAVTVLQEMERLLREQNDRTWLARGESGLLRWTIGYGYHPLWAFWESVGLSALGWVLYRRSYLAGNIVPKEEGACECFKRDGQPPDHYTRFAPLVYAVENSLPLVKLGQQDTWRPEPNTENPPSRQKKWPTSLGRPARLDPIALATKHSRAVGGEAGPKSREAPPSAPESPRLLRVAASCKPGSAAVPVQPLAYLAEIPALVPLDSDSARVAACHALPRRSDGPGAQGVGRWRPAELYINRNVRGSVQHFVGPITYLDPLTRRCAPPASVCGYVTSGLFKMSYLILG